VLGIDSDDPVGNSVRVFTHQRTTAFPSFANRTNFAISPPISTETSSTINTGRGSARGIRLFDFDGDGDLDLYIAEAGRTSGADFVAGLDNLYENLADGRGWKARTIATGAGVSPQNPVADVLRIITVQNGFGVQGSTTDVRILGNAFKSGAQVFFGQGVTVVGQPIVRANSIDVKVAVAPNATPGGRIVFVFNPNGESAVSGPNGFSVGIASGEGEDPAKTNINRWVDFEFDDATDFLQGDIAP
jgi:hypothetical protein